MTHAHRSATPISTHDTTRIDDTRIKAVRPLITPALLQEWLPTPDAAQALVESSRAAISRILHGQDDRLIVVVGPCSIHDHGQAMDYARQLKMQADTLQDDLLIVMRVSSMRVVSWVEMGVAERCAWVMVAPIVAEPPLPTGQGGGHTARNWRGPGQ